MYLTFASFYDHHFTPKRGHLIDQNSISLSQCTIDLQKCKNQVWYTHKYVGEKTISRWLKKMNFIVSSVPKGNYTNKTRRVTSFNLDST
jgi:hypothetical protein